MQSGYYTATGGMVTQFNRLDMIANNLANVNTNGFKHQDVVIGDFAKVFQEYRDELPLRNHTRDAADFVNRSINKVPHIVEEFRSLELGPMMVTGNTFDFALARDDLFFMIETPAGVRLTRDGSFQLNSEGILTTKDGDPVLPSDYYQNKGYIKLDSNGNYSADKDGNIYQSEELVKQLMTVTSHRVKELKNVGDNMFVANENDIIPILDSGSVKHKTLEKSNVNAVREMTALIEANRLVEMYQRVMNTHQDDLNREAITRLSTVKA
ncbi:MAG: flagellar hook-basal body protein [Campylobacterales bacterium]|nr:flagellar hook-basal body protein [Campylobacterales bacterium]